MGEVGHSCDFVVLNLEPEITEPPTPGHRLRQRKQRPVKRRFNSEYSPLQGALSAILAAGIRSDQPESPGVILDVIVSER